MSLFSVSQICVRCEEWSEPPLTSSDLKFYTEEREEAGGGCRFEDEKAQNLGWNQAEDTFSSPATAKKKEKRKKSRAVFSFSGNAHAH